MTQCSTRGVYGIYDRGSLADDALAGVDAALAAGMPWLQYRDKRADAPDPALLRTLRERTRHYGARLIINDDWRLAQAVDADGVHLGQSDPDVATARAALGPEALIGISCSGLLARAQDGVAQGASYVSFGRMFDSTTKPDAPPAELSVLAQARALDVPVVAIGGINQDNAGRVIAAGADLIAVAAAIFSATDPATATRQLSALFEHSS